MLSAARCFVPLPHAGTPCRPRPSHRAPAHTAVSARPRRRGTSGPRRHGSWDDASASGDSDRDARIDADFFRQQRDDHDDGDEEEEEPEPPPPPPTRQESPEPQLRGTDVLRALQRAAAAKEAKKKKPAARRRQGGEKLEAGGEAALAGEVRPVVINPEWAPRVRELELRVQQLADKYHR